MRDYEPISPKGTLPPDLESGIFVRTNRPRRSAGWNRPIASSTTAFIELAHLSDHGRAKEPADDAWTPLPHEAGADRDRCADWFGDWIGRWHRPVDLGRGGPISDLGQLPWTSWSSWPGFQRTIRTGRRGILGHGGKRGQVELHPDDISRSGGDS